MEDPSTQKSRTAEQPEPAGSRQGKVYITLDKTADGAEKYYIWRDNENRILSLHRESGYKRQAFSSRASMLRHAAKLADTGFRVK